MECVCGQIEPHLVVSPHFDFTILRKTKDLGRLYAERLVTKESFICLSFTCLLLKKKF